MAGIVKSLEMAMASNNLETIANTMTQARAAGGGRGGGAAVRLAVGCRLFRG